MITKNEGFVCERCGSVVSKAEKTCRNHCPHCFLSLHVDEQIPGDRKSICGGRMLPTERKTVHGTIKIAFTCVRCQKVHRNKVSADDEVRVLDQQLLVSKEFLRTNKKA